MTGILTTERDASSAGRAGAGELVADGVVVNYSGLRALDSLSLRLAPAGFTGLIGPNGSGKTSFVNAVSGTQRIDAGSITLDGRRIDGLPVHRRARLGVSRTFQAIRLFSTLTVLDNILMGAHSRYRTTLAGSVFRTPASRRDEREQRARAIDLLSMFGDRLVPRIDHTVATLSYANRRRTEIARALISEPSVLLLDEPTAGMNPHESEQLTAQLPELRNRAGCSVLLIEHKMDVISSLCDTVYALDHGVCLASGTAGEIQDDPRVAEAFLGVE